jgi:hypothetical protein
MSPLCQHSGREDGKPEGAKDNRGKVTPEPIEGTRSGRRRPRGELKLGHEEGLLKGLSHRKNAPKPID